MKFSKKTILLLAGLAAALLMSGCGQARLGTINVDKVAEAPQLKAIEEENAKKVEEAQQEILKKFQENQNLSQEEAQKVQMDAQRKIQGLQQSTQLQIQQKLDVALRDIAKEKKLDAVVYNSLEQPIGVSGCTDITEEVVSKLQ